MTGVIALREFRNFFSAPVGWVLLGVLQAILAWLFLSQVDTFNLLQPRLAGRIDAPGVSALVVAPFLGSAGFLLLLLVPLLTMRLFSEERRSGTLRLLQAAPVASGAVVLGKFTGLLAYLLTVVAMISLMPLSLLAGTSLDLGHLAAALSGLVLLLAAFSAIGLFLSSLTAQPAAAAVGGFGVLLFLWIIDWSAGRGESSSLAHLSLLSHYESMLSGLVRLQDVAYFLLLILLFLALTVWRLELDRRPW